jgi:hypothetical protein
LYDVTGIPEGAKKELLFGFNVQEAPTGHVIDHDREALHEKPG